MASTTSIDTPGVYGVSSFNDEETVARDIILDGDIVVNVVDAVHLERDLFLTLQLVDMGKRMVVALNMADEARKQGVGIDRDLLEDLLGVPVIETVAVEGKGFDELKAALSRARARSCRCRTREPTSSRWRRESARAPKRSWCSRVTRSSASGTASSRAPMRDEIYLRRRHRVNDICGHVISETITGASFSAKLSHAMMHPATGVPMLIVLLAAVYVVFGQWVAGGLRRLPAGRRHGGLLHAVGTGTGRATCSRPARRSTTCWRGSSAC